MTRRADRQSTSERSVTLLQQDGSNNKTYEDDTPLRLLGIALVVDQVGKGARMMFRYPTRPLDETEDDLFFRLPPRQMAKLFRPKPALCGQPMTLSVGGTFFCCCAVLMEDVAEQASDTSFDPVVLFSVIVALAPQVRTSTLKVAGSIQQKPEKVRRKEDKKGSSKPQTAAAPARLEGRVPTPVPAIGIASMSVLCIRSVHVSLARLCRVLEREERRCHYVSKQASLFRQIRHDLHKYWTQEQQEEPSELATTISNSNPTNNPPPVSHSTTTSPVSLTSKAQSESRTSLSRPSSFSINFDSSRTNENRSSKTDGALSIPLEDRLQMELEHFLAAKPPDEYSGNLARELAQVYHALGRNEYDFLSSPAALLTGRDGIVYINQHIAVAVEAVAPNHQGSTETTSTVVRPYHTLLFPNATPRQMLDSLAPAGAPRRLQQFLWAYSPKRSLTEIALEANLPLQSTLDMAAYLIHQGVCFVSHVIASSTKVVCNGIDKIQESCLRFSQTFGTTLDLFVLVSLLTEDASRSLGETLVHLARTTTRTTDPTIQWLQEELHPLLSFQRNSSVALDGQDAGVSGSQYVDQSRMMGAEASSREEESLKDLLFRMTVWLFSHRVLAPLCEFLVLTTAAATTTYTGRNTIDEDLSDQNSFDRRGDGGRGIASSALGEHKVDGSWRQSSAIDNNHNVFAAEDSLLRELEQDCLAGTTSMHAASWRTGLELAKVRAWANGHAQVRIVWRVPTPSDDWCGS